MLKHTLITWLATCIVGTLLLALYFGVAEGGFKDSAEIEILVLIVLSITIIASIPAMVLYGVLMGSLLPRMRRDKVKAFGSGYALLATVVSCLITFGIVGGGAMSESAGVLFAAIPYALLFAAAPWIIPMPASSPDAGLYEQVVIAGGSPPRSYYIVAGISGIILIYSLVTLLTGAFGRHGDQTLAAWIWHILDVLIMGISLLLFIRWKPVGWKLITALSAGGVLGSFLSLGGAIGLLTGQGGSIAGYLAALAVFLVADSIALYLLSRTELRLRYGGTMSEYGIWILVGGAYVVVRTLLFRIIYA